MTAVASGHEPEHAPGSGPPPGRGGAPASAPHRPQHPVTLHEPLASVRQRFPSPPSPLAAGFVDALRHACAVVDTDERSCVEAGRDWWPVTLLWGLQGEVPARAGAVARPRSAAEVAAVLATCTRAGVPVTAAGGRSGVCGASVPVFGGVALDLCGLRGVVAVDQSSLLVDVRAGTFGDVLEGELRATHGLTLGHWPQSMSLSTVGGWLACRSAGQYSTRYGKIEDMVVGLEVALADGRLVRTGGRAPREASGPDLTQLFVGSEGTLGVVTEARLRARPVPPAVRRAAFGFAGEGGFATGLDACRRILRRGATPALLRLYDPTESRRTLDVDDRAVLIVVDEADPALADAVLDVVRQECASAEAMDDALVDRWESHRNDVSVLAAMVAAGCVVDTVEVAARWSALPAVHAGACSALAALAGTVMVSAHQSHAYADGACLYFTFVGQPAEGDADAYYRRAWDAVIGTTLAHGGAISHHHGIGLNRGRFLRRSAGEAVDVLAAVKAALDPAGVLNPGKLGLSSPFGEVAWP